MIRRAVHLRLAILSSAVAVLMPATALAGGFSAPVPLEGALAGHAWHLAVNDRGEAVAVSISQGQGYCTGESLPAPGQVVLQRVGNSGLIGQPQTLTMPGFFNIADSQEPSVTLDDSGHVAVGLVYQDGTSPSSCEPHSRECCAQAAIVTWQLGSGTPTLQVLSPPRGAPGFYQGATGPPEVVIHHSTVTALWAREAGEPGGESELARLEQAFGRFGAPLHTAGLTTTPLRISARTLAPGASPFASWLGWSGRYGSEVGMLYTAAASPSGMLERVEHSRRVLGVGGEEIGFANDDEGDTVFAYEPVSNTEKNNEVVIVSSARGRPFSHRRVVARVPGLALPRLAAGGHRALLLTWTESNRIYAQSGSVFGPFGKPAYIGREEGSRDAFLDSRGRAVIVFDRPVGHRHGLWEELAVIGQPARPFGRPDRIAPLLGGGVLGFGPTLAAVSPDGHAVILVEGEGGREYMIRYTP
jgi:hypothetical protein